MGILRATTSTCLTIDIYSELYVTALEVVSLVSKTIKTTLASLHRFCRGKKIMLSADKDVKLLI
jgi:hypothetical protein